jgi:hypothetical protein
MEIFPWRSKIISPSIQALIPPWCDSNLPLLFWKIFFGAGRNKKPFCTVCIRQNKINTS